MAAKLVIDGHMTLGMMMSLQYIIGQLNAPVSQFISFVRECQDAIISMERLGEIHNKKELPFVQNMDGIAEIITDDLRLLEQLLLPILSLFINK